MLPYFLYYYKNQYMFLLLIFNTYYYNVDTLSIKYTNSCNINLRGSYLIRLERMKLKELGCQAKVFGTVVSLGGAFLMALYKGPVVGSSASHVAQSQNVSNSSGDQWLIGACFLLIGCAGFSAFYILQVSSLITTS